MVKSGNGCSGDNVVGRYRKSGGDDAFKRGFAWALASKGGYKRLNGTART